MSIHRGKHAYLIMAHNNFYVLEKLLLLLDDHRNDIYIHIDEKISDFDFEYYHSIVLEAGIFFTKNRITVNWAGFTQIETELLLLKAAIKREYDYYHILSGADLPLRSQNAIHHFFQTNTGKEFIGFGSDSEVALNRVKYIHLFNEIGRGNNIPVMVARKLRKIFVIVQKIVGYNRLATTTISVRKGANWASISCGLAAYVVNNEDWIRTVFQHSVKGDEVFLQTLVFNSDFMTNVYAESDEFASCMRHIDWLRGEPHTFTKEDYEELISTDKLFARKFDEDIDRDIIDMIYAHVSQLE